MHSDYVWLKKDTSQPMVSTEIHAIHHHAQLIQCAEVKAMYQYANVFLAISVIQLELAVIQSV